MNAVRKKNERTDVIYVNKTEEKKFSLKSNR
jgi:hypothetical protein